LQSRGGTKPLLDEHLDFLAGRCRPNTVLAVAFDLKVFFTVVGKSPRQVRPADGVFRMPVGTYAQFGGYAGNGQSALLQQVRGVLAARYPRTRDPRRAEERELRLPDRNPGCWHLRAELAVRE